jgi:vitamin B12 transporter
VDYSDYKSRSVNVDAFNKYSFSNFVVAGGQFQFHEMDSNTPYDAIAAESAKFNSIDPFDCGL